MQCKIAVPASAKVIARPRISLQIDLAGSKPLTWITARAGAGKTTLALEHLRAEQTPFLWYTCDREDSDLATFFYYMKQAARQNLDGRSAILPLLHSEYLSGLPAFTRRFFEQLGRCFLPLRRSARSGIAQPGVIVLDNYQDLPENAALHALLPYAIEGMQGRARMIVLSRKEPPVQLARLLASGQIARLDDDTIRFDREETALLIASLKPQLKHATLETIYERTQGWAAGITLLLENLQANPDAAANLSIASYHSIFDYFAGEVFFALAPAVKHFLMRAALFPVIPVHAAGQLASYPQAQQLLNTFCRNNLFTKLLAGTQTEYQFHPLWREFLLSQLQAITPADELNNLRLQAGLLLEEHRNHEDAARLYGQAGASAELARLIRTHAPQLLRQGRNQTLQEWLATLGQASDHDPWIAYWRGMSAFPADLQQAVHHLDDALRQFEAQDDRKGILMSWAALVNAHAYSLDDWKNLRRCLAYFEQRFSDEVVFPDQETGSIVLSALLTAHTLIHTDQPHRVHYWLERIAQMQQEAPSLELKINTLFYMSVFYLWKGEYEKNDALIESTLAELSQGRLAPFLQIRIKMMAGIQAWLSGLYDQSYKILQEGLQIASSSGVRNYDSLLKGFCAVLDLTRGNLKKAAESLQQQIHAQTDQASSLNQCFYHNNSAWLALLEGKPRHAEQCLQMALPVVERTGSPYCRGLWLIGMAKISFLLDRPEQALEYLQAAEAVARAMQSCVLDWYLSMIRAWILLRQKRDDEGLVALRHALGLARTYRYIHLEFYLPDTMRFLLARALEEQIETGYVRQMIRTLALAPPLTAHERPALSAECWPYPVRIYTMGRFEIFIEEVLLEFSGKEQKKPLEMLKQLIALGGSNVAEEMLSDQLWPETDGDHAHKSFETTLGRLRRLLGDEASILYRSRKLTLNPRRCWVDSLFLLDQLRSIRQGHLELLSPNFTRSLQLASNVFLPKEQDSDCIHDFRSRLSRELLQALLAQGKALEDRQDYAAALQAYQQGIALDSLAEEFYCRQMLCLRQLGNHSEAALTYMNFREQLRYRLGIEPAPQTTAIYRALRLAPEEPMAI